MKKLLLAICTLSATILFAQEEPLELWFDEPASEWVEALPVGNGRLGAMVFGKTNVERIQINEESVWAGAPVNANNPKALTYLDSIRQLLLADKNLQATELATEAILGTPPRFRSYQTLMDLDIEWPDTTLSPTAYRRSLDMTNGIVSTTFSTEDGSYRQEVFSSAPDDVLVVRLERLSGKRLNLALRLKREKDATVKPLAADLLLLSGQIMDEEDELRGPGGAHEKFAGILYAAPEGGTVRNDGNALRIDTADAVTLLITGATDYNLDKLSFDRSIDPIAKAEQILKSAVQEPYDILKMRHMANHSTLMNRFSIELGESLSKLPIDERLENVKNGAEDPGLVELYTQLGRYLLLGSSRSPGVLPANLQGIWNEHLEAPWNSDYHTNINLQMNYWHAQVTNLPETAVPLVNFMDKLRKPGAQTAKDMYGADGWTMHHTTDIYGRTSVDAAIRWGMFPMGGPWMTLPVWRQYEFMRDTAFLRDTAWPILKGSAEFVLDFLYETPEGLLVTMPSYSPENAFIHPESGEAMQLTYAPTMDIQIIRELFKNSLQAIETLGEEEELAKEIQAALAKLPPTQIGANGTIQEWVKDYDEHEPGHRHISHLLGLHPGAQITPEEPELFEAAHKTIEYRLANGGGHTGWSRAWIINFYARLLDAEAAHEHVQLLLQKSTLPNLFDTHPPFQIDGNFGGTAGVTEMLLQSHDGKIHLLPALPEAWQTGHVKGIRARGGFVLNIFWEEGMLKKVEILSEKGLLLPLQYVQKKVALPTEAGKMYVFDGDLQLMKE